MTVTRLQARQRQLLQDWLATVDGSERFKLLTELREVERQLASCAAESPKPGARVHIFAVR